MNNAYPELTVAVSQMLDKIDASLRDAGYQGEPVKMFLAGGMAVNYWCGTRYTHDLDASFSRRLLLPYEEMVVDYVRADGTLSSIYLDANYNSSFALLHGDHEEDSIEWGEIGNDKRKVHLFVLSPVDLAVSKISRFIERDREDIKALAASGLVTAAAIKARAEEAMSCYVGNMSTIKRSIAIACEDVAAVEQQAMSKTSRLKF